MDKPQHPIARAFGVCSIIGGGLWAIVKIVAVIADFLQRGDALNQRIAVEE